MTLGPERVTSIQMLGAWVIVVEAGAIACPTRAVAERVRYLIGEHGMVDGVSACPDTVEGMPWG